MKRTSEEAVPAVDDLARLESIGRFATRRRGGLGRTQNWEARDQHCPSSQEDAATIQASLARRAWQPCAFRHAHCLHRRHLVANRHSVAFDYGETRAPLGALALTVNESLPGERPYLVASLDAFDPPDSLAKRRIADGDEGRRLEAGVSVKHALVLERHARRPPAALKTASPAAMSHSFKLTARA